jgi:hypothetical protein
MTPSPVSRRALWATESFNRRDRRPEPAVEGTGTALDGELSDPSRGAN